MKRLGLGGRRWVLLAVLVPVLALFFYVAVRSGPMAPVPVTVAEVRSAPLQPALFGVGTVEARFRYRIGPTFPARLARLGVHAGDRVAAGQVLGEMDPVDLDDRIRAQEAALGRSGAQLREAGARHAHALSQAGRYDSLASSRLVSEEMAATKRQELSVAQATLSAAREEQARLRAERDALLAQRGNLQLRAPVDGLVTARLADPGTTLVAGQAVVEVIDPASVWVTVRFDQTSAQGLRADLAARIVLRSRADEAFAGRVARVEPVADPVTEELLAQIVFDALPEPLPPLGELAEVTVSLPALAEAPVIPNAAIQRRDGTLGVWRVADGEPGFVPVVLGATDLDGRVQVRSGLAAGDRIVVHSRQPLDARSRIVEVDRIVEAPR